MMAVHNPGELRPPVWPPPISLATTFGISVDVFSWPYLDVSVQAVPLVRLFYSTHDSTVLPCWVPPFGNPRIIADICSSPWLIAACHDLHRLLMPRHPPCALSSLTYSLVLVFENYADSFRISLDCSFYPKSSSLCCLACILIIIHCSVFKVQLPA